MLPGAVCFGVFWWLLVSRFCFVASLLSHGDWISEPSLFQRGPLAWRIFCTLGQEFDVPLLYIFQILRGVVPVRGRKFSS
jgi:hypothetical protein